MMLPMLLSIARFPAQSRFAGNLSFWAGFSCANVLLPAPVPSCFRAGRDKTCYPSPSKRSARFLCRPPFFRGRTEVGCRDRGIKSTGEDAQCAEPTNSHSPLLPPWAYRLAWRPIWNAPVLVPRPVVSPQPRLTAISQPVCLSVRPAARFATTRGSATKARPATTRTNDLTEGRRGRTPGGLFCAEDRPLRLKEGDSQ